MKKTAGLIALILSISFIPQLTISCSKVQAASITDKSKIELVFALDTTGSMSGLIEAAKDKIWSIANTMATAKPTPEIKIGIVGYRDRGDAYVTTITGMTDDLDLVYQKLMAFAAQGGGDGPESVNQALYDAVHKISWSRSGKKTYKVIFLVGDAPPHMDYQNDVKYQKTCKEASKKGIVINTIQCGNMSRTRQVWEEIASLSDGKYFRVSQGGDSTDYKTPFDTEIAEKSKALHGTKVYYGDKKFHRKNRSKLDAVNEIYSKAKPSAIAKRSSYNMSSSGKKNLLGEQELVDSVTSGQIKLEDIKEDELPLEMQKMSLSDRKIHIQVKEKERKQISAELRTLAEKRQTYIRAIVSKEKDKGKNSLDMKIYECIQKQAVDKGIEYKETLKY